MRHTVNLLHSIPGASNGAELISFFTMQLPARDRTAYQFLGKEMYPSWRITERTRRQMLEMRGVTLLPYSPHLNTCEYCFHEMKQQLRRDELYSQRYTEMAIMNAVCNITLALSQHYSIVVAILSDAQ